MTTEISDEPGSISISTNFDTLHINIAHGEKDIKHAYQILESIQYFIKNYKKKSPTLLIAYDPKSAQHSVYEKRILSYLQESTEILENKLYLLTGAHRTHLFEESSQLANSCTKQLRTTVNIYQILLNFQIKIYESNDIRLNTVELQERAKHEVWLLDVEISNRKMKMRQQQEEKQKQKEKQEQESETEV